MRDSYSHAPTRCGELTDDRWRIYADSIAMACWLQQTMQGVINPELKDPRPYRTCSALFPARSGRLMLSGDQAHRKPWLREREGRPFSTSALACSESWTEPR